jgi:LemA protein
MATNVLAHPFPLILAALMAGATLLWLLASYNQLVRYRMQVAESRSGVDTELKRRHDLVPRLVETVKGYARHERETLEAVALARQQAAQALGSPGTQAGHENTLANELRRLFRRVEGYPQLKASQNFIHLQQELANTEDRIQAARRLYNANVREFNTLVESFPTSLLANSMGMRRANFFDLESSLT